VSTVENIMRNVASDESAVRSDDGGQDAYGSQDVYGSIVSNLVSLAGHVQASLQLIEQTLAREAALGNHETSAGIVVLDDVTPRYLKASAALKACDAGLGVVLDLLLDSEAARSLN
jgi:hypothetical protein